MGTILSKLMAVIIAIVCTLNLVPANNNTQKTETPKNNTQIVEERQEDPADDSDIELVEDKTTNNTTEKNTETEDKETKEDKTEVETTAPEEKAEVETEKNELESTGKEEVKEAANYEVVETFDISATPQDDVTLTLYAVPQMARAATFTANNEDEIAVCGLEDEEEAVESKAHVNYLTSYSDEETIVEAFISGHGRMVDNVYTNFIDSKKYVNMARAAFAAAYGLTIEEVYCELPEYIDINDENVNFVEVDMNANYYVIDEDSEDGITYLDYTDDVRERLNPADALKFAITDISFEGDITSISDAAFLFCDGLKSIEIPASVKTIGYNAFAYCSNLTSVTLNNGLETIHEGAFMHCDNLEEITLPATVNHIGAEAFTFLKNGSRILCPNEKVYNLANRSMVFTAGRTTVAYK